MRRVIAAFLGAACGVLAKTIMQALSMYLGDAHRDGSDIQAFAVGLLMTLGIYWILIQPPDK